MNAKNIRNIAIIAHVDHGKTTLVDCLLQQSGTYRENERVQERAMDSMDLEREKGITIKAKNLAVKWINPKDGEEYTINIVDTPGHADFGAEVERVMKMVDGVLLLTDAVGGPQAQTRWVLRKALDQGLTTICVINKVDRDTARPEWVHDKVLELFLDLEADEDQFNAPFLYASAKMGFADREVEGPRENMIDLFETIIERIPPPVIEEGDFRMLASNIDWDAYVGRMAIGRVLAGEVKVGQTIYALRKDGSKDRVKVTKMKSFTGAGNTDDITEAVAGDIVGLAGFDEVDIGDTLAASPDAEALPFVEIDPATIQMEFSVNNGPLAGKDGKKVTSRQIRERLIRETQSNISISIEDTDDGTRFLVNARGSMQIAILVETMRREGFELLVSRPTVLYKTIDGKKHEPFETVWVEVPEEHLGGVMENLSKRKGKVTNMEHHNSGVTVEAEIPTRGLIGFESDLVTMTSGHGVMSHSFLDYRPFCGEIVTRLTGTLVSMEKGKAMAYALDMIQTRGKLFISPGEEVYAGMLIGENPRMEDMPVNPAKAKQLDNMRSSGTDKAIQLSPPIKFSLERAIEYIGTDELVEVTPQFLRLRKRILDETTRRKMARASKK
jgi:GTP-binding protein